jgi:hypothetical protein
MYGMQYDSEISFTSTDQCGLSVPVDIPLAVNGSTIWQLQFENIGYPIGSITATLSQPPST